METLTIPAAAVSGATYCLRCDEQLCSCITHLQYKQRYILINGQPYIITN